MESIMSTVFQFSIIMPQPARAARIVLRPLAQMVARTVRGVVNAWMARQSIQELRSLNDRTLADLGLRRSDIEHDVHRHLMHDWWPQ
jgi:uncharacterized protein YjiS (DUF1127 family)